MIAALNVARYMKNKDDVEALEIPETVRLFLAGFVESKIPCEIVPNKFPNENVPKQLQTQTLCYSQQKL